MTNIPYCIIYFKSLVQFSPQRFILGCSLTILNTFCAGIGLLLLIPLLQYSGLFMQTSQTPELLKGLMHYLPNTHGQLPLLACLGFFLLLITLSATIEYWNSQVMNNFKQDYLCHLQQELNNRIAHARWSYLLDQKLKNAEHMVISGLSQISALTYLSLQFLSAAIVSFFYILFSLFISFQLTAIAVTTALLLFAFTHKYHIWSRGQKNFFLHRKLHEQLSSFLEGIKLAKSYNTIDSYIDHFNQISIEGLKNQRALFKSQRTTSFYFRILSALIFVVLFYIAFNFLEISVFALISLLVLFSRLLPRVSTLQQNYGQIMEIVPVFIQSKAMLAELEAQQEKPTNMAELPFKKYIKLKSVSYAYGQLTVLKNISCVIKAKQITAIIGPSGAGKSTLADLILGLIPPTSGSIEVDDQQLTENNLHSWRNLVSYIPQDVHLFNDTVRANLVWAKPAANDEDLWQALRLAQLQAVIAALPQQLDTPLGDRGIHLSGGERQRLALARALLRQPKILIMDEATSALDTQNEALIYNSLNCLKENMTIILITHRLSTLKIADQIIELKTHSEPRPLASNAINYMI